MMLIPRCIYESIKHHWNQSTIAVTESTKASIFGDYFDEHQFLPTFRLIALDSKGWNNVLDLGNCSQIKHFYFIPLMHLNPTVHKKS